MGWLGWVYAECVRQNEKTGVNEWNSDMVRCGRSGERAKKGVCIVIGNRWK